MTGLPGLAMRTCMAQGVEVPDLREQCITPKPATQLSEAIQA
jgi:hypothetical protein